MKIYFGITSTREEKKETKFYPCDVQKKINDLSKGTTEWKFFYKFDQTLDL